MRRAMLIVNPDSGKRDGEFFSRRAAALLEESFEHVDLRLSSCGSDVAAWSREARERGFDALFVMGGDGTVSLGLRGVFDGASKGDAMPIFAVLPAGTGNGFARTHGIPSDPMRAIAVYDFGATFSFDVGLVNGRPFAHTVTGGALPEGIREVSSEFKTRFGIFSYAASELAHMGKDERHVLRIVIDGREVVEEVNSFVAFSANALVNEFTASENTRCDDGMLHFIALRKATVASLLSLIPRVMLRRIEESPHVMLLHGKTIEISSCDNLLTCGVDGDNGPLLPVRLGVQEAALRMFALKPSE